MNKIVIDILKSPVPKGLTSEKTKELIRKVEEIDLNSKLVYSAKGEKILQELDQYGVKDIPQNYRGVLLEHWLELLSQTQETITEVPRPTGPEATTLTSEQFENFDEDVKRQKKSEEIRANQKNETERFKKRGEEIFSEQQRAMAQKEKQTQELLNQFFKSKVVVIPTEEIPEVNLTKANKETLIAAETAAKEDPATTRRIFAEKIQEALDKSEKEYKDSITDETIIKSAAHLVEQLRSLPGHKTIGDISDSPKALNTLSILNPLANPNSEQMKKIIPNKEVREKFAKEVQILVLTAETERIVNIAGVKAIFGEEGENIAYSLYGPDTITDFQISTEEKDNENGVEISPRDVYEKGKQISDLVNKVNGFRNAEEGTSTGLAYYPTYNYSNAAVATRTASTLTKALPAVGAVYGFKQGLILSQWARSGTPLLSAGNQNLVRLLTSQAGVQEIASASMVTFSNPIGFQLGKFSIGIATGANQATGTQIAIGGIRFGEKMAGAIAVKGGTQVAIVTGTQAGAQLAVGTSTVLTKVLTFVGGLSSWATFGLSAIGGYLLGKIIEKGPQIKKWFQENKEVFVGLAAGGGLLVGGPVVGGVVLFGGLAATGMLGTFAAGAFRVLGFIGRSIGIAIATPVIITLLVIPPLVAFIMLVINNSAYVVPPGMSSSTLNGGADNPYMLVTKIASPKKLDNPTTPQQVIYAVSIKALKESLYNVRITAVKCTVLKKDGRKLVCPDEDVPPLAEGKSISPSQVHAFSFISRYDARFNDSLVIDSVEVTAETADGTVVTTSGSASICIGECPKNCAQVSPNGDEWPTKLAENVDRAIEDLSQYQGFTAKLCTENKPINLCYKPSRINPKNYAWHVSNLDKNDCDIYFNHKGISSQKDALFMITHELTHHIQAISSAHELSYSVSGSWVPEIFGKGFCTYSATNGVSLEAMREGMAEAAALYTNSSPSWDGCAVNYSSKYPKNYAWSKKFMEE